MIYFIYARNSDSKISVYAQGDYSSPPPAPEGYTAIEIIETEFNKIRSANLMIYEAYWNSVTEEIDLVKTPYLQITTDATDNDGDGIADIPADGSSSCTIYIKKYNSDDTLDTNFNEEVSLCTTRGKLSAVKVTLSQGEGQVTLTSIVETVMADILVSYEGLVSGGLQIFFRPS